MNLKKIISLILVLVIGCCLFTGCKKEMGKKEMTEEEALTLVKEATFEEYLDDSDENKNKSIGEMDKIWNATFDWAKGTEYEDIYISKWYFNEEMPYYDDFKSAMGEKFDQEKYHYVCLNLLGKDIENKSYVHEDFQTFIFSVDKETKDVKAVCQITTNGENVFVNEDESSLSSIDWYYTYVSLFNEVSEANYKGYQDYLNN